jgi:protein SCO1/2
VHAFSNEGLLDHSLHTVIVDRQGRLVANIEGNQFTATQLGDVVGGALSRR